MTDWIDSTLRARPVVDDGFSDRVIAIAAGQARTRWLLRGLALLLVCGAAAAGVGGLYLHAMERLDALRFGTYETHAAREARFNADWDRLATLPLFARVDDGADAAPVLNPALARLRDENCRGTGPCDTSFLDGLARFQRWTASDADFGSLPSVTFANVLTRHLQRARATPGAAYAAAVDDGIAWVRLLTAHKAAAPALLTLIVSEVDAARAAGVDVGGATAPLSAADAARAAELSLESAAFLSVEASPAARARVTASRSLLACTAHRTPFLAVGVDFADDDAAAGLRAVHAMTGCGEGPALSTREALCATPESALCGAYVGALSLPLLRGAIAALATPIPSHWEAR